MRKRIAAAAVLAGVLGAAQPAAAQSRGTMGVLTLVAGSGLIAAAFDYKRDVCPAGYTTHTYENEPTLCFFVSPSGDSDTREADTKVRLKRRGLLWAGLGAVGAGAVLLLLPDNPVTRNFDVEVSPERVAVGRTIDW